MEKRKENKTVEKYREGKPILYRQILRYKRAKKKERISNRDKRDSLRKRGKRSIIGTDL